MRASGRTSVSAVDVDQRQIQACKQECAKGSQCSAAAHASGRRSNERGRRGRGPDGQRWLDRAFRAAERRTCFHAPSPRARASAGRADEGRGDRRSGGARRRLGKAVGVREASERRAPNSESTLTLFVCSAADASSVFFRGRAAARRHCAEGGYSVAAVALNLGRRRRARINANLRSTLTRCHSWQPAIHASLFRSL